MYYSIQLQMQGCSCITVYNLDANEQCVKYTSADIEGLVLQHANAEAAKPPWCSIQLQM